jgi:hypothetical protein
MEPYYQPLFDHMEQEHGLTLIDSELHEIERKVDEYRNKSVALLPCPFCGGEAILRKSKWPKEYAVECVRCYTIPGYKYVRTESEAILKWNTRHDNRQGDKMKIAEES